MNTQSVGYKAKAFESRNLVFFFLISLGFPLLLGLLTYVGLLHTPQGLSDPVLFPWILLNIPVLLGPSTAAFVVVGVTEGKSGVVELWRRFWNRNVSLKWLFVAVFILPILRLIAAILTQLLSNTSYPFLVAGNVSEVLFVPILIGLFSGIHEEFGWRGYALPRFQAKWNALVSCIILGILTALWHLPGFITLGEPLFGRNFWEWLPWHMLIQVVGYSWIFNNTKGNVLAVILFHMTTSLSLFVVDFTYYWVLLVAAIIIVVIYGAKNFVRQKTVEET
ncbi:MAG: type II CAAX prenyl endopeptidase Rce1 family protein [Candidatus Kryptoniota bacterium]